MTTLVTDDGLALINHVVSIISLVLVIGLTLSARHQLPGCRKVHALDGAVHIHARLYAIAGSLALLFYGMLAVVTSTTPVFIHVFGIDCVVCAQIAALALRLGILLILGAWFMASMHDRIARAHPALSRRLDRLIKYQETPVEATSRVKGS